MRNCGRARAIGKFEKGRSLLFMAGIMWLAVCSGARLSGQSLQLSAPKAAPGEWITIEISLKSPPGKEILALQWEAEIPARKLDLEPARIMRAVLAVRDDGKSITCAVIQESRDARTVRCILAGGQRTIRDGIVALFSLKILENVQPGTARVRLQNAVAVSRNLERVPLETSETTVTVQ